jgi:tripartite-type tricarboxylate transporter receptor subunit TctC
MLFACLAHAGAARAQDYPARPVVIVVGFAAGGPFENIRPLAQFLEKAWNKPVIVENHPGAGGLVGTELVARSEPDGYKLLYGFAGMTAFKALVKDLRFDPIKDFAPISTYIELPGGFVTNPQVPARTMDEFIAYARANPGKLNYGSLGRNTSMLVVEAMAKTAGIKLTEIPYAGTAPATTGLLRNDVQLINATYNAQLKSQADSNVLRPLLVIAARRAKLFPEIPTAAEKGYILPRFGWTGLLAPANTPRPAIDRIAAEMARFAASPEAQKYAVEQGVDLSSSTPEQMRQLMESESKLWLDIAESVGLQPQ